jgi:hypothetical protein
VLHSLAPQGAPSAGDGKALPALRNTGLIMGRYGVLYAFIFGAFSVGEVCLMHK